MIRHRFCTAMLALYVILGCWKGYVALFKPGKEEPYQIFPTQVMTLPEQDQQKLQDGIPVRSRQILEQLLEDYLS